jgi:hypothetical protein
MNKYIHLKCWEITQCGNIECQARLEPETPCWKIAKRITEGFYDPYKICRECIVYLIKNETGTLSKEEVKSILKARSLI